MRTWLFRALMACALLLWVTGCAKMFACTTDASYIIRSDGTKEVQYSSCKEQIGLDAKFGDVHVKVDKASTQESVTAAAFQAYAIQAQIIQDLIKSGGKAATIP